MAKKYVKKGGHGGNRKGSGAPEFKPSAMDRAMVQAMVINDMDEQAICDAFAFLPYRLGKGPIAVATLRKHFAGELAHAVAHSNISMTRALYKKGLEGNVQAMLAWLERRGTKVWKKVDQLEIANRAGETFNISAVDFSQVGDEDLKLIRSGKITLDLIERLKASTKDVAAPAVEKPEVESKP